MNLRNIVSVFEAREMRMEKQIKKLKEEVEKLTMQLVACSNACLSNTNDSIKELENIHEDYKSCALYDIINTVKTEIRLREENARLREALESIASVGNDLLISRDHLMDLTNYDLAVTIVNDTKLAREALGVK